jgi:hypothetical protein
LLLCVYRTEVEHRSRNLGTIAIRKHPESYV